MGERDGEEVEMGKMVLLSPPLASCTRSLVTALGSLFIMGASYHETSYHETSNHGDIVSWGHQIMGHQIMGHPVTSCDGV